MLYKQVEQPNKGSSNTGAKDLTSTLMNKNMANISNSNSMQQGFQSNNSFMTTGSNIAQPPRSNSFGNANQIGNFGMNSGFGNSNGSSMMPLNNRPAIMPPSTNMGTNMTMGGMSMGNMSMGTMVPANRPPASTGGWTLQNPMTPQGMTSPMMSAGQTSQSTGAKKLSAAELADFLG